MLKSKKIIKIQAFNLKSILSGNKKIKRIKLNKNNVMAFSQS